MDDRSISKRQTANESGRDLFSYLPLSIIHKILELVPIRDVVRTSFLSKKWRYTWTSLPQLIFNDNALMNSSERAIYISEDRFKKFITYALFLHKGPIHKFRLLITNLTLKSCPDTDYWLLFLSGKDIRELCISVFVRHFQVHSCLYSCQKLTHLDLYMCQLRSPPPDFKGFLCLRSLRIRLVASPSEIIETLVNNSPLLESFECFDPDNSVFTITAPNLKHICLKGFFKEISVYAPLLVDMSLDMFRDEDFTSGQQQQKSLVCNYTKFLGGFPSLETIRGGLFFTKYLSTGIDSFHDSLVFHRLKDVRLWLLRFDTINEILVVVRLISDAPNLRKLEIALENETLPHNTPCWDYEGPTDLKFQQLKVVKLEYICGRPHEMKFIEFLLERSPALERLTFVESNVHLTRRMLHSTNADIIFKKD